MTRSVFQRVVQLAAMIAGVILLGTCGFSLVEGWSLGDGLYMTLITLSTVGYGETHELSQTGRAFTGVLIVLCMITMVFWTAGITSIVVSGDLSGAFQQKKERKMISKMSGHVVVCGGGVVARTVIDGLRRRSIEVVAVIEDEKEVELIRRFHPELPVIVDDPKSELALADANVLSADHLVAAMDTDYDNLLITITGNGLGTGIKIFSCAMSTELATRMMKVGATKVISPLVLCGEHVTDLIGKSASETNSLAAGELVAG